MLASHDDREGDRARDVTAARLVGEPPPVVGRQRADVDDDEVRCAQARDEIGERDGRHGVRRGEAHRGPSFERMLDSLGQPTALDAQAVQSN